MILSWLRSLRRESPKMSVASRTRSSFFKKECGICRERLRYSSFISTKGCAHEYCTDCCKRHSEVKFLAINSQIQCPHENCEQNYSSHQCRALLSKTYYLILKKRQKVAATPPRLRFYCPYKDCSAFMRKPESGTSCFKCVSCKRQVCLECNVPWHEGKACSEYRAEEENSRERRDQKLRDLIKEKRWQICEVCRHAVERKSGCNRMTCLCKNEFCYTCGFKWKSSSHFECRF